ncbi:IS1 family transposase [Escherichia coli]|nr:IS1 family transposase [Escherichia coli]MDC9105787.1 IS1 family transposase [Escherichia coli]
MVAWKTVVAHVFGERTMATLGRLMSLPSPPLTW